ncbi:MAG: carboxylesterase, partial [Serratia sp.]|nr:carboxylesterase [Serratia sp. (in: enterobacteria)]
DIKKPGIVELAYPVVPVPAVRQIYALMGTTRDLLPAVTCPLLVFQSREDHVVHPDNAPFIFENVSSNDKALVWLENSYHVATLDNDQELIAERLVEFVHRLSA